MNQDFFFRISKTLNVSSGIFHANQSITKNNSSTSFSRRSFSSTEDTKLLDKSSVQTPKHTVQLKTFVLLAICMQYYVFCYLLNIYICFNFQTRYVMKSVRMSLLSHCIKLILQYYNRNKAKYSLRMTHHGAPQQTFSLWPSKPMQALVHHLQGRKTSLFLQVIKLYHRIKAILIV